MQKVSILKPQFKVHRAQFASLLDAFWERRGARAMEAQWCPADGGTKGAVIRACACDVAGFPAGKLAKALYDQRTDPSMANQTSALGLREILWKCLRINETEHVSLWTCSASPLEPPAAIGFPSYTNVSKNESALILACPLLKRSLSDVYGHTQATVGRRSLAEQTRRQGLRETASAEAFAAMSGGGHRSAPSTPQYADLAPAPDPHPLGKSRAEIVRNHWVPTIPGYGGYVPAKHAENICGGGIMHTCKMAGRAIAERAPMNFEPLPAVTQQDDVQRARLAEYYHSGHRAERSEVHVKLATELREHCSKSIPGYMGYIPRVKSDSIYGARPKDINRIAADLMEDWPQKAGHQPPVLAPIVLNGSCSSEVQHSTAGVIVSLAIWWVFALFAVRV
ncbi:unnamed protein product [Polarella glacialis]|uniref:Uncharacterized protein n=1 Tax=Polarella glacialis TaxID=89957 RepID=A0A813FD93_POLGL|nr:unnamed protein product [Polarella glacialis]